MLISPWPDYLTSYSCRWRRSMMCCRRKLTRTSIVSTTASFTKCVFQSYQNMFNWYVPKKSCSDITFLGDITSVQWSTPRAAGAQWLHLLQRDGRAEGNGHDQIPDQGSQDACCHQSNPPKVSSGQIEYWIWNCVGIKPDDRHADVPNYQNPGL